MGKKKVQTISKKPTPKISRDGISFQGIELDWKSFASILTALDKHCSPSLLGYENEFSYARVQAENLAEDLGVDL